MKLKGKNVLVTGASRGIGRAIATRLSEEGAFVIAHYGSRETDAKSLVDSLKAKGGNGFTVGANLADVATIPPLFESIRAGLRANGRDERIDVLVNNAGVAPFAPFSDTSPEQFDEAFDLNVKGLFFVTQSAITLMATGGKIINISSVVVKSAFEGITAYAATKGAVDVITRHLAGELGPKGITVNSLSPGATDTDMSTWLRSEEGATMAKSKQALKRVGTPNDIASAAVFLASPESDWVTGQVIDASGGWNL